MFPLLTSARHVKDHALRLQFADGAEGEIDLLPELDGEIFLPLRELDYFKRFRLDPEIHTIVWPNGADFAPEFLYAKITVPA